MKYRRIITVVAIAALMLPLLAYAQGPGGGSGGPGGVEKGDKGGGGSGSLGMPRGAWWERSSVVKQLNLSKEQQQKIQTIALAHRKEMIMLRAELEIKEVDLDPLLAADKLDEKKIKDTIGDIEVTRAKISKSRMNMLLEVRKVLTRDQYVKLKQYKGTKSRRVKRGGPEGGKQKPGAQRGDQRAPGGRGAGFPPPAGESRGPMAGM